MNSEIFDVVVTAQSIAKFIEANAQTSPDNYFDPDTFKSDIISTIKMEVTKGGVTGVMLAI